MARDAVAWHHQLKLRLIVVLHAVTARGTSGARHTGISQEVTALNLRLSLDYKWARGAWNSLDVVKRAEMQQLPQQHVHGAKQFLTRTRCVGGGGGFGVVKEQTSSVLTSTITGVALHSEMLVINHRSASLIFSSISSCSAVRHCLAAASMNDVYTNDYHAVFIPSTSVVAMLFSCAIRQLNWRSFCDCSTDCLYLYRLLVSPSFCLSSHILSQYHPK